MLLVIAPVVAVSLWAVPGLVQGQGVDLSVASVLALWAAASALIAGGLARGALDGKRAIAIGGSGLKILSVGLGFLFVVDTSVVAVLPGWTALTVGLAMLVGGVGIAAGGAGWLLAEGLPRPDWG